MVSDNTTVYGTTVAVYARIIGKVIRPTLIASAPATMYKLTLRMEGRVVMRGSVHEEAYSTAG